MHIYIPSRNRSENVKTLASIPASWHSRTFLLVNEKEWENYGNLGFQILTHNKSNISDIRQWAIEHGTDNTIFMIDDDIHFHYRDTQQKLPKAPLVETEKMFNYIAHLMDKEHWAATGIEKRAFARDPNIKFKYNGALTGAFGFNRQIALREKITFNGHHKTIGEDHFFNLSLLIKGYQNIVMCKWAYTAGQYTPGGCDTYRTVEIMEEAFETLAKLFPKYVKRMDQKYPTGNYRYRIAWSMISKDHDICDYR